MVGLLMVEQSDPVGMVIDDLILMGAHFSSGRLA